MSAISRRLAEIALEIKAIKLSPQDPFTWTSGYRMPIYNDNRLLLGSFEHRALVADGFVELIERHGLKFEVVAGIATAGVPFGTTLADRLRAPFVYIREKPKTHGTGKRVEGVLHPGERVLLIEDLISMGTSSTSALEALRSEGGAVESCLSIFNYEFQEARDAFARVNAVSYSLLGFAELLQVAREKSYIPAEQFETLASWSRQPTAWGEAHGFPKLARNAGTN